MVASEFEQTSSDFLHRLIWSCLLITDGRTTDLLETLLDEKVTVDVIQQEQISKENAGGGMDALSGSPYYIRESVLIGQKSRMVVSHNIALVYAKNVPLALFESISQQQQGIGKAIHSLGGVRTFRSVEDFGFINKEEMTDLFQCPIKNNFSNTDDLIPYKRYFIYFGRQPGIQMLEYYHPDIIRYRLQKEKVRKDLT